MKNQVAQLLQEESSALIDLWFDAVRDDERLVADHDLTRDRFVDRLPAVIDEICLLLQQGADSLPGRRPDPRPADAAHYRPNGRARDVVCELSVLRTVLQDFLDRKLTAVSVDISLDEYFSASRLINSYLDEELRCVVSVYTEQDARARLMSC